LTGSAGQTVTVALRPEMIALTTPDGSNVVAVSPTQGTSGANRLPGTVADVAFLGSVVRVHTTIGPDATSVYVDTFNNPNLAVPPAGSPVVLSFPPEGCLVLGHEAVIDKTDRLAAAEAML
jgi:putative spermidine/putrescine transport system ATP-binding protein